MKTEPETVSQNNLFYAIASLLLLIAAFIFLCRFFITPDLIYPTRIDSLYVKYEAARNSEILSQDMPGKSTQVFFNPASLGMTYQDFTVKTTDGLTLKGWYVEAGEDANTLLIIHDLSQSKLNYLNMIKQMHDRGLNVCGVDMRAHGNSEGDEFSPGMVAVSDVKAIFDSLLKKTGTNHIAVFGVGLGAAIAIECASFDGRSDVLILQSPFSSFSEYVNRYVKRKWGRMAFLFHSVLERELEVRLQYELTQLDLSEIIKYVYMPTLVISGSDDEIVPSIDSYAVFDSSAAREKKLYLVRNGRHDNIEQLDGEDYYNCIAEFILNTIPKKPKETRFKKLATG